jgi:hypothetical protein
MLFRELKNISFFSRCSLFGLLFLLNACTDLKKAIVHDYPKQIPFVYDNKIIIKDAETKGIFQDLSLNLNTYWDDSLKAKRVRQYAFFNTLLQPVVYQPERIGRTVNYMQNYLASVGYYHPNLDLIAKIDTVKDEYRVHLTMSVKLNKKTIIDTVTYSLNDTKLAQIANDNKQYAYVKKGMPFSNESINNELDRLVNLFRTNGYFYFTKEKIFAEVDTINKSLMNLYLDPLEQVSQIEEAEKKQLENPRWKISFQLRNIDSTITKAYPIGGQIFYSDLSLSENPDDVINKGRSNKEVYDDITHQFNKSLFKPSLFEEQSIIHRGNLYNEQLYYQTLNNFSGLGAWQQIDARSIVKNDSINIHYFLVPNLRRSVSVDLEGSKNTAQIGAGNLLGLSTSFTYRDRNVQKKSIQSISNFRTGVELNLNNSSLTQTLLFNLGQTYSFPVLLIPFKQIHKSIKNTEKTNFSLNGSFIDRLEYYRLKSFTSSWGYEWKNTKRGNENLFTYKPLNVEFYQLQKFAKLDSLLILNPFLRSSFNNGNVISQTFNFIHTGPSISHPSITNYYRIGIEEAGGLMGLIPKVQSNIYRYIKAEVEMRKLIKFDYTELAWRIMGGWGNNYSNDPSLGGQLPFFKQFTAGGPYSMRAWGLRQLGLGSSLFYDSSSKSQNFDRFGDVQLETNLEYRFNIIQWGSYKIRSALFADIGNIWNARDTKQDPKAGFELKRLYNDLAIGIGTGLRLDFNYFLIRIDYAMKFKDPSRENNNGWLDLHKMKWTEVKANGSRVNNFAWQFGIGLPF